MKTLYESAVSAKSGLSTRVVARKESGLDLSDEAMVEELLYQLDVARANKDESEDDRAYWGQIERDCLRLLNSKRAWSVRWPKQIRKA